jgi:predicted GIY-YIG superfamily endonuclease
MKERWSVYIVRCADATLYTGIARSVKDRVAAHNAGRGARYTRGRLPVRVVHEERGFSLADALRRERAIKRLPRERKLRLVRARPSPRPSRRSV